MNKSSNPFGDNRTALAFFLSLIVIISYVQIFIEPSSDSQNRNAPISPTTSSPSSAEAIIPGGPLVGSNETGPVQVATEKSTPGAAQGSVQTILPTNRTLTAEQQEQLIQEEAMKYLSTLNDTPKLAVKTSLYTTEISQLGAQMLTFELEQYSKSLGSEERFNVIGRHVRTPLPFRVELLGGSDARIQFSEPVLSGRSQGAQITTTEDGTRVIELSDGEEAFATYQVDLKEGGTYTKTFRFVGGKFIIDVKASLSAPSVGSLPLKLSWSTFIPEELVSSRYDPINFSFLTTNDKVEHEQVTSLQDDAGRPVGNKEVSDARWGALGDKYFMAALVAKGSAQSMTASRAGNSYSLSVQGTPQEVEAQAYLGPKNYSQLKNMDFKELHRSVNLGFFSFLAIPLLSVINVFYTLIGNYGLAIIALTLAIKFLFLPLSQVSLKSMKAMQEIQPEVKALRERIKDANQLNQEMFALYKRKGVNPMGGCLPMLIQIPVFLGLYNALLNATELRHAPFALWITDLSAPEALMIFGIPVPIMIILMGISMFLQQWLMPSNMDEQQRKIMLLMPVVFTGMFIIFPFPSGLVLYWLVNNLISIVQQVYLRTEKNVGPVTATSVASIGIFLVAYLLTEIS